MDNEGAEIDHLGSEQCHESVLEKNKVHKMEYSYGSSELLL